MTSAASARCVDSGVMVAAFAPWHERHSDALRLMVDKPRVVAHSLVEAYSVLTRLPAPFRAPAAVVAESLARRFPDDPPLRRCFLRRAPVSGRRRSAAPRVAD